MIRLGERCIILVHKFRDKWTFAKHELSECGNYFDATICPVFGWGSNNFYKTEKAAWKAAKAYVKSIRYVSA